ncbi:hypothetical protein BKP57_01835 [Virgibacillus sp. 6R]|uniref:Uncharacterized protein n=1 Tax=Virgibacillus pantothenticus TaxID=1473 RepID=A0A0L0QPW2_VIRPA|nr:hypothetical protein BKP57_01835 [Virgibacillus sp. 6R]KNE20660.1 hypothetical protein AFK71_20160 [Virgibacillus pantothenticus]
MIKKCLKCEGLPLKIHIKKSKVGITAFKLQMLSILYESTSVNVKLEEIDYSFKRQEKSCAILRAQ